MAHYAIAGYGCVKAFASRLGLSEEAEKLGLPEEAEKIDTQLSNTYDGDDRMTAIATGGLNAKAV